MIVQHLLSLPPAMAEIFPKLEHKLRPEWFAACDPPGGKLGSGGGVAHLLVEAWRASKAKSFSHWLLSSKRLALLAGGQSRRLPAYGAVGKILMPIPVLRWAVGQRLDQTLLDLQAADYRRVLEQAPASARVLIASGDVFLRFDPHLPPIPEADIVGLGMWVSPEIASHFGVFFSPRRDPAQLAFFLQKPSPARIRELARDYFYLVDTGLWLLSERAVSVLLKKCGWNPATAWFRDKAPGLYEIYAEMGPALGSNPQAPDPDVAALTSAVVPLHNAEFYHFGTTRQMIESLSALQNREQDQRSQARFWRKPHPDMYVLNADFPFAARSETNRMIWVENSSLPPDFPLAERNAVTGVPRGDWKFALGPGQCIDIVPIGDSDFAVRPYGFDDQFKGSLDQPETLWLGEPAAEWFRRRQIPLAEIGPKIDIQEAPLFAIVNRDRLTSDWIDWLISVQPSLQPELRKQWLEARRLSANELGEEANLQRVYRQRREYAAAAAPRLWLNRESNPFFRVDLENAAELFAASEAETPSISEHPAVEPLDRVHETMFCAAVARRRGDPERAMGLERDAFALLSETIVGQTARQPVSPVSTLIEDQILWGRSPVRLDLAGGWSDTPPFCLKHGGAVVNVAVDLNGQPPVQVFARVSPERRIIVRSIDLGAETVIRSFGELEDFAKVGGEFSLAKAALCLAGFHPRFSGHQNAAGLPDLLDAFGGGLEISLLAATPKGSGLGTSSVLAATLLGTLASAGGLAWDKEEIFQRTLALEQLLTTGGGWQDQAGGLYHGVKIIETSAGLEQKPAIRWLPEQMFGSAHANRVALLYYTGITRVAKAILQEIVRGMFLNANHHLARLMEIREHARTAFDAIQRESWTDLCGTVRRSWELNQALDAGTNPPEVQQILAPVEDYLAGVKLLGAGGGGYMLMLAKDQQAAARVREQLTSSPPNPRARFVDFALSNTGLQITRS